MKYLLLPFMIFGLAGCEKVPEQPVPSEETGGGSESGGEQGGSEGSETSETVYTVTEAEFDDAVDLRWKNLTYTGTAFGGSHEDDEERCEMYFLADGSSYQKECFGWGAWIYQLMPDGTYRVITKDNGSEEYYVGGYKTRDSYVQGNYGDDFGFSRTIQLLAGNYSSFTFSEETNSYAGQLVFEYMMDDPVDVTVKFENKHLVTFEMTMTYMGQTGGYHVDVKDYGTTEIKYDEFSIVDNYYVAGREFVFDGFYDEGVFNHQPELSEQFIQGNQESKLTMNADGTFLMHYDLDFDLSGSGDYSGTYVFNKTEGEVYFHITQGFDEEMDIVGRFSLERSIPGKVCQIGVDAEIEEDVGFRLYFAVNS